MAKYLRIKNRGECPRLYLTLLGATTKDDKMEDPSQGGWFGSGTKYAPIAAFNLGISVAVASRDLDGKYFIQYKVYKHELPSGRTIKQLMFLVTEYGETAISTPTRFTLDACKNWKESIGHDGMKSFRVLREYLRNAVDADPDGYKLEECDLLDWPPEGWTYVYISLSEEIREMLKTPRRYFKYVAHPETPPPLAVFQNGSIHERSDTDKTRIFSLGTLAFCSKDKCQYSLYDYSVDVKRGHDKRSLLTEERTFSDMGLVYTEIKKMLASWRDVDALAGLIKALVSGKAQLEARAMTYSESCEKPAAAEWLKAWKLAFGDQAIISSNPYADELVRYSYKRVAVAVSHAGVRVFLKQCGVPEATELIPGMAAGQEYRCATNLEDWEIERLKIALEIMHEEFPESTAYATYVFEPLTERMKTILGFTNYGQEPKLLFVQRVCLSSWNTLIATLVVHECRHARTKADDSKRDFVERADRDIADLLIDKHGLKHEPEPKIQDIKIPVVSKKP